MLLMALWSWQQTMISPKSWFYFETHYPGGERGLPGTAEPTLPTHVWSDNRWTRGVTPRANDSAEAFTAHHRAHPRAGDQRPHPAEEEILAWKKKSDASWEDKSTSKRIKYYEWKTWKTAADRSNPQDKISSCVACLWIHTYFKCIQIFCILT